MRRFLGALVGRSLQPEPVKVRRTMSEHATRLGQMLHDRHMAKPSFRLLVQAMPDLGIEDIAKAVEELNEGGAGVSLSDWGMWERMLARKDGWYWVRARHNGTSEGGPGEWQPLRWRRYEQYPALLGSWDTAGHIRARYGAAGGSYHALTEMEIEIIETPIFPPREDHLPFHK